jgi:Tesmin/TSO1-like CXC domain, cysteine-rich domain
MESISSSSPRAGPSSADPSATMAEWQPRRPSIMHHEAATCNNRAIVRLSSSNSSMGSAMGTRIDTRDDVLLARPIGDSTGRNHFMASSNSSSAPRFDGQQHPTGHQFYIPSMKSSHPVPHSWHEPHSSSSWFATAGYRPIPHNQSIASAYGGAHQGSNEFPVPPLAGTNTQQSNSFGSAYSSRRMFATTGSSHWRARANHQVQNNGPIMSRSTRTCRVGSESPLYTSHINIPKRVSIPKEISPLGENVSPMQVGKRSLNRSEPAPPVKRCKTGEALEAGFDKLDLLCSATLELGPLQDNPSGCSCPKSKCIALYCDCFKAGRRCNPNTCSCLNCKNTVEESGAEGARSKVSSDWGRTCLPHSLFVAFERTQ